MQNLLIAPFIILPFLVNTEFSDPTLLFRRTSLFFMLFIILLSFNFYKIKSNKFSKHQIYWIYLFLLFLFSSLFSSYSTSVNFVESIWGLMYMAGWLCLSITFFSFANKKTMSNILIITSFVSGLISILSILQAYGLYSIENLSSTSGTFFNRNFWGMYLCFSIPASFYAIIFFKDNKSKLIHIILASFSFCSLIHSRSRAAWVAIFIGFIFFVIIYHKSIFENIKNIFKIRTFNKIYLILPLVVMIFIGLEPEVENVPNYKKSIWSTLTSSTKDGFIDKKNISTIGERASLYKTTLSMIQDNILIGVGYNNWRLVNPKYFGTYVHDENYLKLNQRPHNDLLWITSESGIIGLLIFMFLALAPLFYTVKKIYLSSDKNDVMLDIFLFISIVVILTESLFDFPKQRTIPNLYLWSYIGFLTFNFSKINIKSKKIIFYTLLVSMFIGIFSFMDYKSISNSQKMKNQKRLKNPNDSIKYGMQALKYGKNVDNTGTPIKFNLGIAEYQKGDIIKSEKYFNEALKIHPYHIGTLENLMIIKAKSSNYTEATKIMNELNNLYPHYYSPVIKMIKIYLQKGDVNKAKMLMEITNFDSATQNTKKMVDNLKNYIILHSE